VFFTPVTPRLGGCPLRGRVRKGNYKTRIHGEGKKVMRRGRLLGLVRKQVADALAHEGVKKAPNESPASRCGA
jgi:hypothetical protein